VRAWVVVASLIAAVVFIGLGFVFLGLDLGTADQIASVASFVVGLAALIMAIVFRNREPRTSPEKPQAEPQGIPLVQFTGKNKNIQIGNGSVMNVNNDHRKRRWFQR
jgi:hypothetical protein